MFRLRFRLWSPVAVNGKIRTVHAAQVAAAALVRRYNMRWMIAFGIKRRRKREHFSRTEFHAESARFTSLDNYGNAPFRHKYPHKQECELPFFMKNHYGFFVSQDGVMWVTESCEAGHRSRAKNLRQKTSQFKPKRHELQLPRERHIRGFRQPCDPYAAVPLVPDIQPDQQRVDLFHDPGILQFAAVNGA